jgi:hypothetical protein
MVRILARVRNFSLLKSIQTDSETHPAPYLVGTAALPWGKKVTND